MDSPFPMSGSVLRSLVHVLILNVLGRSSSLIFGQASGGDTQHIGTDNEGHTDLKVQLHIFGQKWVYCQPSPEPSGWDCE
mmetsp:Transcript_15776/g.25771  ORF Transcript_15776/g.25771 Transcript_15776/m.25771 type:complete len:80 (+) Transcript_15776:459-698(+)